MSSFHSHIPSPTSLFFLWGLMKVDQLKPNMGAAALTSWDDNCTFLLEKLESVWKYLNVHIGNGHNHVSINTEYYNQSLTRKFYLVCWSAIHMSTQYISEAATEKVSQLFFPQSLKQSRALPSWAAGESSVKTNKSRKLCLFWHSLLHSLHRSHKTEPVYSQYRSQLLAQWETTVHIC